MGGPAPDAQRQRRAPEEAANTTGKQERAQTVDQLAAKDRRDSSPATSGVVGGVAGVAQPAPPPAPTPAPAGLEPTVLASAQAAGGAAASPPPPAAAAAA